MIMTDMKYENLCLKDKIKHLERLLAQKTRLINFLAASMMIMSVIFNYFILGK